MRTTYAHVSPPVLLLLLVGCRSTGATAARTDVPLSCPAERFPVQGACVSFREAEAYCGPSALPASDGCRARSCPAGELLDRDRGVCVPTVEAVDDDDPPRVRRRACAEGTSLVVAGGSSRCVPRGALCPRGHRDDPRTARCARSACPAATIADGAGRCVRLLRDDGVLDAGAWALSALGPHGGVGSPELCEPLERAAARLALGAPLDVRVAVVVTFPANEIGGAYARFRAWDQTMGASLAGDAARAVEGSLATLLEPLRSLAVNASTTSVETTIRCFRGKPRPGAGATSAPGGTGTPRSSRR